MEHHQHQQKSEEDVGCVPLQWNDPLQMLAKQCDTISGSAEEERVKGKGKNGGGTTESGQPQAQTTAQAAGKVGTNSKKAAQGATTNNGTTQQNGKTTATGAHFGDATPKQSAHQKTTGGQKVKSPSKDPCSSSPSTAALFHAPPPAAFLPGASFAPPPAHLTAAMMAGGFLGVPPPPGHRPSLQHFAASAIGMPNGGHSPPLGLNHAMQQLMAAAMQQQQTAPLQQQMGQPQLLPQQLFNVSTGVPLPPSMSLKKANQLDASAANLAMPMHPFDAFAGATFLPPNGVSSLSNGGDGGVASVSALSIPALLMACASGQLPQGCLACTYRLKDGQLCGSVFPTEEQLFAHYKNAHIGKQSSPNAVSSTTSQGEQPVGTTTASATNSAGKKGPTGSPSSSRSTPIQQTSKVSQNGARGATAAAKPHSNPGAMFTNGTAWHSVGLPTAVLPMVPPLGLQAQTAQQWKEVSPQTASGANHRFHPYAQSNGGKQSSQTHQHSQNPNLQQMAMAINNLGLMANLGALPAGFFPPGIDFALLAQQQLGQSPAGAHPATPPATTAQQSQLAALAAMANSIGSNVGTPSETTARQQPTGGVATLEAVDG